MKGLRQKLAALLAACATTASLVMAQTPIITNEQTNTTASKPVTELKLNLSPDGSRYLKATFLTQVWLRYNQSNPGTTVNGDARASTVDIGLRRTRAQLYGQLTDHVFFYTQFGLNNFNYLSQNAGNRKLQAFFHDMLGEYKVFRHNDKLKLGGGLSILSGLSRFSQPSIGSIMTTDVPVFLQATVDQTDEFARKLSVYARGQLGRFDYRVAFSDPFPIQTNGATPPVAGTDAQFSTFGHSHQYQGFLIYNFLDKEPHTTPYMTGTFLGDRKVLNLEAGLIYQDRAMFTRVGTDTSYHQLLLWSAAAFLDMPLQQNRYALSAYAGYFHTDYGPNYLRNNGLMNPANGNADPKILNGAGNAYPMFGTGSNIYTQVGLRLPNDLFGELGTLMPYASWRWSDFEKLNSPVNVYDAGINWLINKHMSKLSFNYQLRPVFERQTDGSINRSRNAGSAWLQYQVFF